ncbi:MAG: TonB C-terminal domain-containing protein [Desulfovibrio sp.]|nr:TonB C-terminal domain-containing protein [Desulfovibrio sp.]
MLVDAPSPVPAAGLVTGGTANDGYVACAFEKIGRHWSPPPGLHGDFTVQVEVIIDERGGIAGCTTRQSSGMVAFDAAACGAVEQTGNLGVPPGNKPMTLYCTFQSQRERERLPDPDEKLQKDIRARMDAQNRFSTQRAGWAEEDARYKAEKAARAQGQTFEGYDFSPGQNIPGAREILERPVRVQPGPQHSDGGAGKGKASPGGASANSIAGPVAGMPVSRVGRGSPQQEEEADLAVAPGKQPSQEWPGGAKEQEVQAKKRPQANSVPGRPVTFSDISAGIVVRHKGAHGSPVQASARPAARPGAVSGGKGTGKGADVPAGKTKQRSSVAKEQAQAPEAPASADRPDDVGASDTKQERDSPAPVKTSQPRAEQRQPAVAGKAPSFPSSAWPSSEARPDGDASAASSMHASAKPVPADASAGTSGGKQEGKVPVPGTEAKPSSVPNDRPSPQPDGVKPGKPSVQFKPSAAPPSPPSGEVRGPVVYPPEYGNSQK